MQTLVIVCKAIVHFGYTPKSWRDSETIFIPKPGKETYNTVESFRPITLSNFMLKGFERVEQWRLERTHFKHKPLSDHQFAFRKGRSTETALSRTINKIEKCLGRGHHGIGVFLDIKGAFDRLDHTSAINAMKERGLPGDFLGWYEHYLKNRTTTTRLAGHTQTRTLKRGTPQGGVLSPMVWNIVFEQALLAVSQTAFITGFADDGCIIVTGERPEICRRQAQEAVDIALNWGRENGLEFHAGKTEVIHFRRKKSRKPSRIVIDGVRIPYTNEAKYLGVIITHNLVWTEHLKRVTTKAKRTIYAAQKLVQRKYGVRPDMMHWIWTGCVIPIVLYGCHLWAFKTTKTQQKLLDNIAYMALTTIAHCHKGTPLAGLQVILNAPPLELQAQELAMSALDRLQLHWQNIEPTFDDLPRDGHLKQAYNCRHNIVGDAVPDYDIKINQSGKFRIHTRQATEEEKAETDVYTDGSKMHSGVGCAYTIVKHGNEITYGQFKLQPEATVYQAEQIAIEMAAQRLTDLGIKGRIHIHTDSLSSLQALKGDYLTSKQTIRTKKSLETLSRSRGVKLKLFWVKAHVGIQHNERADQLAKQAICNGIPSHVETSRKSLRRQYARNTAKQWEAKWQSRPNDYKRTRVWFPKIDAKTSQDLLCESRGQLSSCVQWITGFCNLMRHRHKKNAQISDRCRLCHTEMETPEHLSFDCPRLVTLRTNTMLTHAGMSSAGWNVHGLAKFVSHTTVAELLTDDTTYRQRNRRN
jgi:ribonuclease HI